MEPHDQLAISGVDSPRWFCAGTNIALTRRFVVERVTRIELAWPAWKVAVVAPAGGTAGGKGVPERRRD
jgi:hypothetical protein